MQRCQAAFGLNDPPRQTAPWEIQWGQLDGHEVPFALYAFGLTGRTCFCRFPPSNNTPAGLLGSASACGREATADQG